MTVQSYLIIENNVVTNAVMWDGGPDWTPPAGSTAHIRSTMPAKIWVLNETTKAWELQVVLGAGGRGHTWDGTHLTTNQPMPTLEP